MLHVRSEKAAWLREVQILAPFSRAGAASVTCGASFKRYASDVPVFTFKQNVAIKAFEVESP